MGEKIKYHPIEKRTPEGQRWVVVSSAEVAIRALAKIGIEKPSAEIIQTLVLKAKSNRATWDLFQQRAHELRLKELESLLTGIVDQTQMTAALCNIHRRYAEIDGDQDRNFNYLDRIILGNNTGENQ